MLNSWTIADTFMSEEQLDVLGNVDMHDNRLFNLPEPEGETDAVPKGYVDALEEHVDALEGRIETLETDVEALRERQHRGAFYRWAVWSCRYPKHAWPEEVT